MVIVGSNILALESFMASRHASFFFFFFLVYYIHVCYVVVFLHLLLVHILFFFSSPICNSFCVNYGWIVCNFSFLDLISFDYSFVALLLLQM